MKSKVAFDLKELKKWECLLVKQILVGDRCLECITGRLNSQTPLAVIIPFANTTVSPEQLSECLLVGQACQATQVIMAIVSDDSSIVYYKMSNVDDAAIEAIQGQSAEGT